MSDFPFRAKIISVECLGGQIFALRLSPSKPYLFTAGQYCFISLNAEGQGARAYSIASTPSDDILEFHIRDHGAGFCAALRDMVCQGGGEQNVWLSAPQGEMLYTRDCQRDLVLMAGGTGYAPIRAILSTLLVEPSDVRNVDVFIAAREAEELYMRDEVASFKSRIGRLHVHFVVEHNVNEAIHSGTLKDLLIARGVSFKDKRLYIAGPPAMVMDIHDYALDNHANEDLIHWDKANVQQFLKQQKSG